MRIPGYGKPNGPCETICGHRRCFQLIQTAGRTCPGCGDVIGFDRDYTEYELNAWHDECLRAFKGGVS
jgi:hypothetical protein